MDEINKLRQEVDKLDQAWLEIISKRYGVTKKIGDLKKTLNMDLVDPTREQKQMQRIAEIAEEFGIDQIIAQKILRVIIDGAVARNKIEKS